MRTLTGIPRCEGTLTSAPRAASGKVTGTVTVRLWPDLPKTGCADTCTRTYRSPAGPPRSPGAPFPLSLMRWPSPTPAGMRAWMVRLLIARPLPEQTGQGSSTTSPRPRHSRQGSENAKLPRFLLAWPVPSQDGHTRGTVPALAPVPMHALQGASPASRSDTVVPSVASPKLSDASVSTSAPRRGRCCCVFVRFPTPPPGRSPSLPRAPPAPPPPDPPKRSPRSKPYPPPGPGTRVPLPKSERASSYSLRRFSSDSTLYASEISLKRSSDFESPLLASGWYLRASLRYDFLISSALASLETARTL